MSNQRFSPEFKDEAIRQMVDRGYPVAEVSERLGVLAHSRYKWMKAVKPDKTDEQASALIEARSEVMRLRLQLKGTEKERHSGKSRKGLCSKPGVKYCFLNDHRHEHQIRTMCRVQQVSSSSFYGWLSRPVSNHAIEDRRLLPLIRASYNANGSAVGARRVFQDLRGIGKTCGKHRVERLMKANKITAVRAYKIPRGPLRARWWAGP